MDRRKAGIWFLPLSSIRHYDRDENGVFYDSDALFLPNPVSLLDITDKTTKRTPVRKRIL